MFRVYKTVFKIILYRRAKPFLFNLIQVKYKTKFDDILGTKKARQAKELKYSKKHRLNSLKNLCF